MEGCGPRKLFLLGKGYWVTKIDDSGEDVGVLGLLGNNGASGKSVGGVLQSNEGRDEGSIAVDLERDVDETVLVGLEDFVVFIWVLGIADFMENFIIY